MQRRVRIADVAQHAGRVAVDEVAQVRSDGRALAANPMALRATKLVAEEETAPVFPIARDERWSAAVGAGRGLAGRRPRHAEPRERSRRQIGARQPADREVRGGRAVGTLAREGFQ